MQVSDLREAFESIVDDRVNNKVLVIWLNEAQEDVALSYGRMIYYDIEAEENEDYDLPDDFLKAAEVIDKDNNEYWGFKISKWGQIRFKESGSYRIYYHKVPDRIPHGEDGAEPDLHELLHPLLYLYAASMFYDRESLGDPEESAMATKLRRQYQVALERRVRALRNRERKNRQVG